nr:hypothetical protein [Megavirus caiporensis]
MKRVISTKNFTYCHPVNILNIYNRSFVTKNIIDSKKNKDENIKETNQAIISGIYMTQVYPNMFDEKSISKSDSQSNSQSIESNANVKSNDLDHYEHIYECDYDFD